jgi:glutathione S-transferase
MEPLILHQDPISGNSYKIKLTASLISVPIESRTYHVVKGETRTPQFLNEVSPSGKIPVLQIGKSTFLPESGAICYYLAENAASHSSLIPADPLQRAEMLGWMFFEQNQVETTLGALRFWVKFLGEDNLDDSRRGQLERKRRDGVVILQRMDDHLGQSESGWFVGDNLTLADIALFAYTHLAGDAGFELENFPHVTRWFQKIAGMPGFLPFNSTDH